MIYIVQKGDTLSGIAKTHGTTVSVIMSKNSHTVKDPNVIVPGMQLTLPDKTNYSALGKKVKACLDDIENLKSFKEVMKILP